MAHQGHTIVDPSRRRSVLRTHTSLPRNRTRAAASPAIFQSAVRAFRGTDRRKHFSLRSQLSFIPFLVLLLR
jgi:hypothetical protein